MTEQKTKESIPPVVSLFLKFYYAIPRKSLPGTSLDVSFMICWMAIFSVARLLIYQVLIRLGWPENALPTMDASACVVGVALHASSVVPLSWVLIRTQNPYRPSAPSKVSPQWWQDAVEATLQICTAYMLYDSIFLLTNRYTPGKGIDVDSDLILYAGHHLLTSFYMTSSRLCGAGQASALACIFLGEVTNHSFNLFLGYGYAEANGLPVTGIWRHIQVPNEIFLALTYIFVRAVLAPINAAWIAHSLLVSKGGQQEDQKSSIPLVVRLIWILMILVVIHGSIGHNIILYNLLMKNLGLDFGRGLTEPEL